MTTQVILWICTALAAAIFGWLLWSVATFKSDTRRRDRGAAYLHSRLVEVLWALIPIAIFIGAALPVQRMIAANHSRAQQESTQLAAAD